MFIALQFLACLIALPLGLFCISDSDPFLPLGFDSILLSYVFLSPRFITLLFPFVGVLYGFVTLSHGFGSLCKSQECCDRYDHQARCKASYYISQSLSLFLESSHLFILACRKELFIQGTHGIGVLHCNSLRFS